MEARTAARLAWMTFGMVALGLMGALGLLLLNGTGQHASDVGEILTLVVLGVAMFSFPVVGVLIASRQPRNAIGWILLAIGFVWEVGGALGANYVQYGFFTAPGSLPGPEAVAVLASSVWVPGLGLIGTFLILLFPDGRRHKMMAPMWRQSATIEPYGPPNRHPREATARHTPAGARDDARRASTDRRSRSGPP